MGVMESILGHIIDLGYEAADKTVKDKYDESRLKEILTEFITSQKTYFGLDSLDTEIDYQGLFEYIKHSFIDEVSERIYDTDSKKRGKARQDIIDQAIEFSSATTEEAKASIKKLIGSCLDMYRQFYRKQLPRSVSVIAGDITDSINSHTDDAVSDIKNELKSIKESVVTTGKAERYLLGQTVIDARNGKLDIISDRLSEQLDIVSMEHPLRPYYRYKYNNQTGRLESSPVSRESLLKYPLTFRYRGIVNLEKLGVAAEDITTSDDLVDYSFRHQIPIVMDVKEVRKYLGDMLAPDQPDPDIVKNGRLIAIPKKFPQAFPCSVKVGNETYFEYVLLRTKEILDDGTIIVSNTKQYSEKKTPFYFELYIQKIGNDIQLGVTKFNIGIKNAKNQEYLKYLKFMKAAAKMGVVTIHILSRDEDFVKGYISTVQYSSGLTDIDKEIDLMSRVCLIENFIHDQIIIPHKIGMEDIQALFYLSELINHKCVYGKWTEATMRLTISQETKDIIKNFADKPAPYTEIMTATAELFGKKIGIEIMRVFKEARIADLNRVKEKVDICDIGDEVMIRMIPGNENDYADTMDIPEKMRTNNKY